ncbi:response regulator transcription factor [Alkalihalobacillus oceani]|uniref:Response regulator transcription factor n=1 Tax=Halalkalibacter oceani TaxID=1653776 RepID=A0A9X2DSQ1_9BACI|nr:response regulator transcription factor [Halalkalibacter oceani]MCM3715470.1 response regulator transcription factor [Halalkalibacter oceani]
MNSDKTILIVDDEWNMRNLLTIYLQAEGFRTVEASDGQEALATLADQKDQTDLVILDIMMPLQDGFEICQRIREYSNIPILMLSARKELHDRVEGLNRGADDYLTKPFESEELIARIHALLRRANNQIEEGKDGNLLFSDGLQIYYEKRQVYVNNELVELTAKEFDLLYKLAASPKRVFTREDLLRLIWGEEYVGARRTVDSHIKNIRSKLEGAGLTQNRIATVWSVGYKFI